MNPESGAGAGTGARTGGAARGGGRPGRGRGGGGASRGIVSLPMHRPPTAFPGVCAVGHARRAARARGLPRACSDGNMTRGAGSAGGGPKGVEAGIIAGGECGVAPSPLSEGKGGGGGRGGGGGGRGGGARGGGARGGTAPADGGAAGRGDRGGHGSAAKADKNACSLSIKVAGDERVLAVSVAKGLSVPALREELLRRWQQEKATGGAQQAPRAASNPAQVRLIFAGRLLEDDKTLEDYVSGGRGGAAGAGAAHTIHMVLPAPELSDDGDSAGEEGGEGAGAGTAGAADAGAQEGDRDNTGGGRRREAKQDKKAQELRIPCEARYYRAGGW